MIKILLAFLFLTISISAQEMEKAIDKYGVSIRNDYKKNTNLKDQLESFQVNYLKPDFSRPIISIAKTKIHGLKNVKYVYTEIFDSSIVVKYNESKVENYFLRKEGGANISNKVEKSLSEFLVKDDIIIASYGSYFKDIVVFKRKNSLLYPIFISTNIMSPGGDNFESYMKNLGGDTLVVGRGGGDEGDYFYYKRYYMVNDLAFQLLKTIEIQGIDKYRNYIAECKKIIYYDELGNVTNSKFESFAENHDGSLVYKELFTDSLKIYKIDPLKDINFSFTAKEYKTVYIPEKKVQISGPSIRDFTMIIKYAGENYIVNKIDLR